MANIEPDKRDLRPGYIPPSGPNPNLTYEQLWGENSPVLWRIHVRERVERIPEQDRQTIEHMLFRLIKSHSFGYTLFGAKPISCTALALPNSEYVSRYNLDIPSTCDWHVWEKYAHQFEHDNIAMRTAGASQHTGNAQIIMINIPQLAATIEAHQDFFISRLGQDLGNKDRIIAAILNGQPIEEVLGNHMALVGILFGFGKNNSLRYEELERDGANAAQRNRELPLIHIKGAPLGMALGEPPQISHTGVGFRGDPHSEESLSIWNRLVAAASAIEELLKSQNFLEDFLGIYMGIYGRGKSYI